MCGFPFVPSDKTIKLWKISERDKRAEGYNLKDEDGRLRDPFRITSLRVRVLSLTPNVALFLLCLTKSTIFFFSVFPTGSSTDANGSHGRSKPPEDLCKCTHLSH